MTPDDPGKRWHYDCGGEVMWIDGGEICLKCGDQADEDEDRAEEASEED
jgi:hypothetical protein